MAGTQSREQSVEEVWRTYLTAGQITNERLQCRLFRLLPGSPRCKNCYVPFGGLRSVPARLFFGKVPSRLNPNLCNICERFARKHQGGAEVELSLLFADVRGSTGLSERMTAQEYSKLINRFHSLSTQIIVRTDALIDKIIGDQVAAMYVPGFAGPDHAQTAVQAAQRLLQATGHLDRDGPWIPLGVAVHTGAAFVGSLGSEEATTDITVLGDAPITAARLASAASRGEILINDAAYRAAGLDGGNLETRRLELNGKSDPITVHVLAVAAQERGHFTSS